MFANGCVKVYRSGSLSLFIYCLLIMLFATVVYGQDTPVQAEKAAAPGDIFGTLVDSVTNEPISGATVTVNTFPPQTTTTDAKGKFRFLSVPVPDQGQKNYTLTIEAKDGDPYNTTEVTVTVPCSSLVTVTIKLVAVVLPGIIEGWVELDNTGFGILGVDIKLFKDGELVGSTITNIWGDYWFENLEAGEYTLGASGGIWLVENGYIEDVQVENNKTTIVDFTPKPLLRGSVVDSSTNAGISGVTVTIINQEGEHSTDVDGKFELVFEDDGNQRIQVTREGYNPAIFNVQIPVESTNDPPVFGLSPVEDPSLPNPGSIAGIVMTPGEFGGTPNVKIELYLGGVLVSSEYTDVYGQYKFESVQPGTYRVVAKTFLGKQIGEQDNVVVESNGLATADFIGMPTFQGHIVDGSTGDPIGGATVTEIPGGLTNTTGPDGIFNFDFDTFGHHDFVVSHEGHNTAPFPVTITVENVNDSPTLSLDPVPQGQPTPGTIMGIVTSNMPYVYVTDVTMKLYQSNSIIQETTLSETGFYFFSSVAAGTYSVSAVPPPTAAVQTRENIEIKPGDLYNADFGFTDPFSGFVFDLTTNNPIPGVDVTLQPGGLQAATGDQGEFQFDIHVTGDYDCFFSKEGYKPEWMRFEIKVESVNDPPTIQLQPQQQGNGGVGIHLGLIGGEETKGADANVFGGITLRGFNVDVDGGAVINSRSLGTRTTVEAKKGDDLLSLLYNVPVTDPPVVFNVPLDLGNGPRAFSSLDVNLPESDGIYQLRPTGRTTIPVYPNGSQKSTGTSEIEYIKGAEYFMGDDPGQGNGTPMDAVDGTFDGEVEDVITTIDITGWETGLKIIFMRALYSDDTWSLIQSVGFYHESIALKPPVNLTVTDVENDYGYSLKLDWELSPDDALVTSYRIFRSRSSHANYGSGFDFYESIDEVIEAELTSTIIVGTVPAGVTTFLDENICVTGVDYYYWIQAQGEDAVSKLASPGTITEIEETPLQFTVSKPYPNPFNPSVTIAYTLPERRMLSVVIYDILGRKIRVLDNTIREAGSYRLRWDGLDENGLRAGSGIYMYRLRAGEFSQHGKMLLLR